MNPRGVGEFVGRAGELALLSGSLEESLAGRGGAIFLTGDGGVGKSRLVKELVGEAHNRGVRVLNGRCVDLAGPGSSFVALLQTLGFRAGVVAKPWCANGCVAIRNGAPRRWPVTEACTLLDSIGTETPAVLVVEDLHWADDAVLDFVSALCRAISGSSILLVATYRNEQVRLHDRLARMVVEVVRAGDAWRLDLAPLDVDDTVRLIEDVIGTPVPAELSAAIVSRSGGNPFFAIELAANKDSPGLPPLLGHALLQQVYGIGADAREVLLTASAFHDDVSYRQLALTTGLPEPRLGVTLRHVVDHGLLVVNADASTYRFRHPLLAEAVYSTILPGEKERVHEAIARRLTDDAASGGRAGDIARHWSASGRSAEALRASIRAADEAESRQDLVGALHHLRQALDHWNRISRADQLVDVDVATLLGRTAELADLTGAGTDAVELVRRAIAYVDVSADPLRAGQLYERLAGYLLSGDDAGAAMAACRSAHHLIPARPASAERARVLTTLGAALLRTGRYEHARRASVRALETAQAAGNPRSCLGALGTLALCHTGEPEGAHDLAVRDCAAAREHGSARDVTRALATLCEVLIVSGRPHEVAHVAQERLALPDHDGAWSVLATRVADASIDTGDWDRADELLSEVHRIGGDHTARDAQLSLARLAVLVGRYADAQDHLDGGTSDPRQPAQMAREAAIAAELALWRDDPDRAGDLIDAVLTRPHLHRNAPLTARLGVLGLRAQADRVEIATSRRELSTIVAARRRSDELVAITRRAVDRTGQSTSDVAAYRAAAAAEHARAQRFGEPSTWQAAVAAWDSLGRVYAATYSRWRLAESLLLDVSGSADLVRTTRAAHQVAGQLGAVPLREQIEAFARRARVDLVGGTPQADLRSEAVDAFGLTAREDQVLELVARGYTNRQIGDELAISVKTASVHVTHILQKLGVARRAEAGALAYRLYSGPAVTPRVG